jgi:hypothetical protein
VLRDARGFIVTGREVQAAGAAWPLGATPSPRPACPRLAAGDVRCGSVKGGCRRRRRLGDRQLRTRIWNAVSSGPDSTMDATDKPWYDG